LIKDAYGSVQALASDQMKDLIKSLKEQSSVCVEGTVLDRGKDRNNKIPTGQIEVCFWNFLGIFGFILGIYRKI